MGGELGVGVLRLVGVSMVAEMPSDFKCSGFLGCRRRPRGTTVTVAGNGADMYLYMHVYVHVYVDDAHACMYMHMCRYLHTAQMLYPIGRLYQQRLDGLEPRYPRKHKVLGNRIIL